MNANALRLFGYIFSSIALTFGFIAKADEIEIPVNQVGIFGVTPQALADAFQVAHDVHLDLDSMVKVSPDDEGNGIQFENLDHLSVLVPYALASGPFNKVFGTFAIQPGDHVE